MKSLLLLALPLLLVSCDAKEETKAPTSTAPVEKVDDLVCGMKIPKASAVKHTHDGKDYYFCAEACLDKFKADPKKYVK